MPAVEYPGSTYPAQYATLVVPLVSSWLPILPPVPFLRHRRAIWHWLAMTRAIVFPLPLPLPCPTPVPPVPSTGAESCTTALLGGGN